MTNWIVSQFPKYLVIDGIEYLVLDHRNYSYRVFLEEYQQIVFLARNGLEKSQETCEAVNKIHDELVLRLHFQNTQGYASGELIKENRGVMQLAKLAVARIWQEGKQARDEYVCPECGDIGRVNLDMNELFPCPNCRHTIDMREEILDE